MEAVVVGTAEIFTSIFIGICYISSLVIGKVRRSVDHTFMVLLLFDFCMLFSDGIWYFIEINSQTESIRFVLMVVSYFSYYCTLMAAVMYVYRVIQTRQSTNISALYYHIPFTITVTGLFMWFAGEALGMLHMTQDGFYVQNEYYYMWQVTGYLIAFWLLFMVIIFRKNLSKIQVILFSLVVILPALVALLRTFTPFPNLLYPTISIMIFVMYIMDYIENQSRFLKQKQRLTDAELAMMISQVQPHFLYNIFNTIYYLCAKDVDAAQEAIGEFSDYLRTNLDSLSQKEPVMFSEELMNIKRYVYLEKLRFEDKLDVKYEIESDDFRVPVLSIRPLVENAIKHGVGKTGRVLEIKVSVKELDDCFEVEVKDNGPGYDPANIPQDGRSHVGLENLRQRLILISGTTLSISGIKGVGTRAVIKFDKN